MLFVGSDESGVQSKRKDNGNARKGLNVGRLKETQWECKRGVQSKRKHNGNARESKVNGKDNGNARFEFKGKGNTMGMQGKVLKLKCTSV